jgi:hypothetical protein
MRRAVLLLMIIAVVAGTTGVAVAAFIDTTSNSGNSFAAASTFDRCYYDDVVADSPVSYWRLDETSGTTAADVQGANNGTYQNSPTLGQSGALAASTNKAVQLDGVNDYVNVPHNASLDPNSITVEAWAKSNGATWNTNGWLVSKRDKFILHPDQGTTTMRWYIQRGAGWQSVSYSLPDIQRWHDYVGVYNASTGDQALYVDGRVVASATYSAANLISSTKALTIGADDPTQFSRYGNGWIDEVAVYSGALSAARVLAHYNSGRCYRDEPLADNPAGYWRLGETGDSATAFDSKSTNHGTYTNGANTGSGNLLSNPSFESGTTDWSASAGTLASVTSPVRLGSKAVSVTGGGFGIGARTADSARPAASAGKTYTGWAYFRPATTALTALVQLSFHDSGGAQLQTSDSPFTSEVAGQWVQVSATGTAPANTASVRIEADVIVPGGTTHYIDSAQLVEDVPGGIDNDNNDAASFDGSNDYIAIPHTSSLAPTSAITVEAWAKPDSSSGSLYSRVVAKPYTSYTGPYNDYALITNGPFAASSFELTIGGTQRVQYGNAVLPAGGFSHMVGTYDGSTMKFYVNGVLTASDPYTGSIASSGQPLQIGRLPGGNYFDGTVDEVAVYGSALSESRIQAHYIAGRAYRDVVLDSSPVSYWRLGESSGTSAADEKNAHNGTYTNGPTLAKSGAIAGNQNTAVSFDGVDDHVTTGDLSVCEGTNFSIEAWAKGTSATTNLWITSEGSTTTNNPICGLVHEGANARFYVRDNAGTATTPTGSTGTFNDGNWHHLVGVRNGNTFTLYVDGAQAAQTTATLGAIAVDTSAIGALKRAAVGNYYPGTVDDVAIYNTALSATQAKLHYDAGRDSPR